MIPTLEQWQLCTGSDETHAAMYYQPALIAMDRFAITEVQPIAAFCATLSVECIKLTHMEEDLYYRDAERLAKLFKRAFDANHDGVVSQDEIEAARPYCRMPASLSMKLYNGYHGRGGIQLTWEKNYAVHGTRLGFDYVTTPEMVCTPDHAILVSASYWDLTNCNSVSDNMDEVTFRVNGPARLALAERIAQYNTNLEVLA